MGRMEPLYLSGVVGLIGLMAVLAFKLRRSAPSATAIALCGETQVGAHRLVMVEVEGHKLLVSHTQNGLHLLAAFSAPVAAAQSTTAAQPIMRSALAPESGPQALPVEILPQVSSPNRSSVSAEQPVVHASFDFGVQQKSEPTQQFPFEIQQVAASARR
jgi:flagellar biogenesis protein FliO